MCFYFSHGIFAMASNTALGFCVTRLLGRPSCKGLLTKQRCCHKVQGGGTIPPELPVSLLVGVFLAMTLSSSFRVRKFCNELPAVPRWAGTSRGQSMSAWKSLPNTNFPDFGRSKDFLPSFLLLSTFWLLLQINKTADLVNKGWQKYANKMARLTQLWAQCMQA